jgi:hypothetical protein
MLSLMDLAFNIKLLISCRLQQRSGCMYSSELTRLLETISYSVGILYNYMYSST